MTLDILMPFYGRVDQYVLAVESVLAQTDPDWHLTVIDDQYPDLTAGEWTRSIDDQRITYLRNEKNLGVAGNFQHAVDLMREPYAVIMGSDDVLLPDFVRVARELTVKFPDATIIQPGVEVIDGSGDVTTPLADRVKRLFRPSGSGARALSGQALAISMARANWAYFPSLIWQVAALRRVGFRQDLEVALDLALLLRLVREGATLVLDDEVVFRYRRHSSSVSAFTAVDGTRFVEESSVLYDESRRFRELGWNVASRVAKRHVTSRLNALSVLPAALRRAGPQDRRTIVSHIFESQRSRDRKS
jgi:glycosyltransferase involved in cell wall biosynthesis